MVLTFAIRVVNKLDLISDLQCLTLPTFTCQFAEWHLDRFITAVRCSAELLALDYFQSYICDNTV